MIRNKFSKPVLLFLISLFLLSLAACGEKKEETTEAPAEEPGTAAYEAVLPFQAETLTIDDWTVEVRGLAFTDTVKLSDIVSYNAGKDELYAIVSLNITNGAGAERAFLPVVGISGYDYLQDEFQEGGQKVKASLLIGYDKTLRGAVLQPEESREGTLVYSISRSAAESGTLELFFNKISGLEFTSTEQKTLDSVSVKFR